MVCFASTAALPRRHGAALARRRTTTCTLTPERTAKKELYRVLEPESERPRTPPRHQSLPYVGFFVDQFLGKKTVTADLISDYGRLFSCNYLIRDMTYISEYHTITQIMRSAEVFTSVGAFDELDVLIPNSMMTMDGSKHAKTRAILTPAFSTVLFPYYFPFFTKRAVATWKKVAERTKTSESLRLDPMFREHYLSVIVELTTGLDMESTMAKRLAPLFKKVMDGLFLQELGPLAKISQRARDELLVILRDVVKDNLVRNRDVIERLRLYEGDIAKLANKDIRNGDVNVLLVAIATSTLSTKPGAVLDDYVVENLAYSIMILWLAGYTTSAATSTTASLELGMDASIQAKLVAEQDALMHAAGGVRDVTYEQTASGMPLLDSYLTEILRRHPAIAGQTRIATRDVEVLGYFIPKGSAVFLSFDAAQADDSVYPNASIVIPERFLAKPKPPPVLSFGAPGSPHYCIGATLAKTMMKATFATLLREYTLDLDPAQSRDYRLIPEKAPKSGCVVRGLYPRRE